MVSGIELINKQCASRHKNDISKGVRARYSALSNILLQRKDPKISSNLLPAAKEVLGNDKEQEQFYENFGYNEDLSQLHISRKDYKAAFQLALKQGKHEEALKLCQTPEAASMVPEEQLLALYNCLEAQRLWSHPRGNPLETKLTNSFRETPTSALRAATLGWDFILSVITESGKKLILERPPYDTSPAGDFLKTWGSEIFDLYVR